ncbi:MAG: hypothetical protein JWM74_1464 [Myxococcaceae bacterium]|jgi:hypothetical protein|nr:hypothetical protein [Myxococcaceae bacterium]
MSDGSDTFSADKTIAVADEVEDSSSSIDTLASMSMLAIGEVIGQGGMGVVRSARQRSIEDAA